MTEVETYSVKVCRDCGAEYSTAGMTTQHKKATGHDAGFKTVKRTRPRRPMTVMYQPGWNEYPLINPDGTVGVVHVRDGSDA
jgi:hypothetical protein